MISCALLSSITWSTLSLTYFGTSRYVKEWRTKELDLNHKKSWMTSWNRPGYLLQSNLMLRLIHTPRRRGIHQNQKTPGVLGAFLPRRLMSHLPQGTSLDYRLTVTGRSLWMESFTRSRNLCQRIFIFRITKGFFGCAEGVEEWINRLRQMRRERIITDKRRFANTRPWRPQKPRHKPSWRK